MKIQPGQADAFIRRPDPGVRAVLLYGPDGGMVRERAGLLIRAVIEDPGDPFRLVDLPAAEILRDPSLLAAEAAAIPMLGGRRAVRVREASDALSRAVGAALDAEIGDAVIILEAGELGPRSSLRQLVEKAERAAAIPCYMPQAGDIAQLLREMAREASVTIDGDAAAHIAECLTGDRQLARREIEKLLLWAGSGGTVDLAAARAMIGDSAAQSLDDLVFAVGGGDVAQADRILGRLEAEGVSQVSILRAALRHFGRLFEAQCAIASGASPDRAVAGLRPPPFFKLRGAFLAQLRRWPTERLGVALARLMETEAAIKRTGAPAAALTARALLSLAHGVRR